MIVVTLGWVSHRVLDSHPNALKVLQTAILGDSISDKREISSSNSKANPPIEKPRSGEYWMQRIREGGLILHFRHFQRDKRLDPAIFDSCEINN